MQDKKQTADIAKYATGRFTLLELMGLLAAIGIVLTVVLKYFFG